MEESRKKFLIRSFNIIWYIIAGVYWCILMFWTDKMRSKLFRCTFLFYMLFSVILSVLNKKYCNKTSTVVRILFASMIILLGIRYLL